MHMHLTRSLLRLAETRLMSFDDHLVIWYTLAQECVRSRRRTNSTAIFAVAIIMYVYICICSV